MSLFQTSGETLCLSNTETESLTKVLALPKIYFAATYSFTEADEATRSLFLPHFKKFDGIYLTYWDEFRGIDNNSTIKAIIDSISTTHSVSVREFYGNGYELKAMRLKTRGRA